MALDDKLRQLDEKVAMAVRRAVEEVQQQVAERLDRLGSDLNDLKGKHSIQSNLPETFFDSDELESEIRQAAGDSGSEYKRTTLEGLRDDLAAIDRCGRQAEILDTLLDRGSRYAPRLALFLLRDGTATGWGARGFEVDGDAVRKLSFETSASSPLGRLAEAGACLDLGAAECASLCSHLESAIPESGVLIPLILRDHLVAALYADLPKETDSVLEPAALQSLTHVSCLAVESLAFRERSFTSTLIGLQADDFETDTSSVTSTAAEEVEEVTTDDEPPTVEATAEVAASGQVAAEVEEVEEIEVEIEIEADDDGDAGDLLSADGASEVEEAAPEQPDAADEVDEEPEAADVSAAPPADSGAFATTFVSTVDPSDGSETAEVRATTPVEAEAEDELLEVDAEVDVEIEVEDAQESRFSQTAEIKPDALVDVEVEDEAAGATSGIGGFDDFDEASVEDAPELEAAIETPSVAWQAESEASSVDPVTPKLPQDVDPDATLLLNRPRPMAPAGATVQVGTASPQPESPKPEAPKTGEAAGGSGQVQPPEDLDGPGWAFSATTEEIPDGEGAVHDEARRLARLLVSEIQLYNQDEVEVGRRSNDIYERLKEDIDRSRQMYDERIDPSVRDAKDYFYEELVRVLAAGDPRALGI